MKVRLICLEITGFKSFQKKKKIPLNANLIAIVGPNGCGKSNIFEAFLWVFGKSSKESLRLEGSSDIFYESLKGESVFFAEVTLKIEVIEKEGSSPKAIDFTRRFYKKGDNKYFVNYKSVNFSDYEAFLQELHLFPSSYILLAQEKSNSFLTKTSAPEILSMIEEIAGLITFKNYKQKAQKNIVQIQIELKTKSKICEEMSFKYKNYESIFTKKSQAIALKEKLDALEIKLILLDMYHLYKEREKWEEVDERLEKNQKNLINSNHIKAQLALLRERLKNTEEKLKYSQKEKLTYERSLERTLLEWDSLTKEIESEKEIIATFKEKIPPKKKILKELIQEKDHESVLLNDLMRLKSEIEYSFQKIQNSINESFFNLVHKLPKDLTQKISHLKEDFSLLKDVSLKKCSDLPLIVKKFINSHEIFWQFLETLDAKFLSVCSKDYYKEFVSLKENLNRQEDKVNRLKSLRSEREQDIFKNEKEYKDWIEEETVHKNHFDMLSLREEVLREKRELWKESLERAESEKLIIEDEIKKLRKLIEQWQEKEGAFPSFSEDFLSVSLKEGTKIDLESRWISLKRLLPEESYWQEFLESASEKDLETYNRVKKEKEEVKKSLLPLKIWLLDDFKEKEYEKFGTFYKENLREKKDLENSLKSSQKMLKKIEREYQIKFEETLNLLNKYLKEISQKILIKGYVILEPHKEGLSFKYYSSQKSSQKSLKVLSGGEKVNVFLSFLLAAHKISQSPFIFLDEIDSSLDEPNADFWLDLLKGVSIYQQVFIITHNPKISQKADLVLGVTLSQEGDSEVHFLDLNKEGEFI